MVSVKYALSIRSVFISSQERPASDRSESTISLKTVPGLIFPSFGATSRSSLGTVAFKSLHSSYGSNYKKGRYPCGILHFMNGTSVDNGFIIKQK